MSDKHESAVDRLRESEDAYIDVRNPNTEEMEFPIKVEDSDGVLIDETVTVAGESTRRVFFNRD